MHVHVTTSQGGYRAHRMLFRVMLWLRDLGRYFED